MGMEKYGTKTLLLSFEEAKYFLLTNQAYLAFKAKRIFFFVEVKGREIVVSKQFGVSSYPFRHKELLDKIQKPFFFWRGVQSLKSKGV